MIVDETPINRLSLLPRRGLVTAGLVVFFVSFVLQFIRRVGRCLLLRVPFEGVCIAHLAPLIFFFVRPMRRYIPAKVLFRVFRCRAHWTFDILFHLHLAFFLPV